MTKMSTSEHYAELTLVTAGYEGVALRGREAIVRALGVGSVCSMSRDQIT